MEKEKTKITCYVCGNEGHRARDCDQERKVPGSKTCKHCNEEGHIAKECPSKEPEICRNCHQEGHRAKECENERVMVSLLDLLNGSIVCGHTFTDTGLGLPQLR